MNAAHLAALDLNLLVVLHVLLDARSTTAAARRLGRTQSAISHALRRLRDVLDDPLFVRSGAKLVPTTFAVSLAEPLDTVLRAADVVFRGERAAVEPARLERTFTLAVTDLFGTTVLPELVARLRRIAPGVDMDVRATHEGGLEAALEKREIDLAVGTRFRTSGFSTFAVGVEDMVVLLRRKHPAITRRGVSLDAYCAQLHVLVAPRGQPGSVVDDALARLGRARRIALRVPHFTAAVLVASRTDLVTTIPRSFARVLRGFARFEEAELPLASPVFPFHVAILGARAGEPALAWFAEEVARACRAAFGPRQPLAPPVA